MLFGNKRSREIQAEIVLCFEWLATTIIIINTTVFPSQQNIRPQIFCLHKFPTKFRDRKRFRVKAKPALSVMISELETGR